MATFALSTENAQLVTGPPQGRWTHAAWERLGDDGNRYEIIDGVLYVTTAPSSFHQWIIKRLERFVGIPAEDQGLGISFYAPIGVFMPQCDPVQPDFLIVLKQNMGIIHDRRIHGVPDVIVEVLSPSNAAYDQQIKFEAYERAGVPEYALVDPRTRTIEHYQLDPQGSYSAAQSIGETETFAFAAMPSITFTVGDLFAGAPDTSL